MITTHLYSIAQTVTAAAADGALYAMYETEGFADSSTKHLRTYNVGPVVQVAAKTYMIWQPEAPNPVPISVIAISICPSTSEVDFRPYALPPKSMLPLSSPSSWPSPPSDDSLIEEAQDYLTLTRREHPYVLRQLLRAMNEPPVPVC